MTLERLTTGVAELDGILNGGIPKYATVVVAGPPGSGKTVLCQQLGFANGAHPTSALYLGTLSEPVLKMMRNAQEFRFFVPSRVGRDVVFGDLGDVLTSAGGAGLIEEVDRLVKLHRPEVLVIDSFKVIREHFDDVAAHRAFVSELMLRLAAWQVTTFLVGEYTEADLETEPEFAVADGIVYLYGMEERLRQRRFLRIMKMRGTSYFAGEHLFEISAAGIEVYPRMDPTVVGEYAAHPGKVRSHAEGLTEMIGGGLNSGSSALIAGGSGTGKTLCALSFLAGGAADGTPGLLVSFEERPDQLVRNADQFGWGIAEFREQGLIDVLHVAPAELDLDKHASIIRRRAETAKAGVVVIDTISALEGADRLLQPAHNYLWAITDYFKRMGVTVILTYESDPDNGGGIGLKSRLSFVADTLIELDALNVAGLMRRTLQVRKMRGTTHDTAVREFLIEPDGLRIGDRFDPDNPPAVPQTRRLK